MKRFTLVALLSVVAFSATAHAQMSTKAEMDAQWNRNQEYPDKQANLQAQTELLKVHAAEVRAEIEKIHAETELIEQQIVDLKAACHVPGTK